MISQPMHAAEPSGYQIDATAPAARRFSGSEGNAFGHFVAHPAARTLTCGGEPVELGSRAFDLLMVLLRSRGEIVSKDDIVRAVWPSTTVDESNLRFQMTCLRRALGPERERIKTVPGRGYLFVDEEALTEARLEPLLATRSEHLRPSSVRKPAIVIIDEDPANREALHRLLRPFDAYVQSFVSVEAFFASALPLARQGLLLNAT